jgi:predicted dehydrogenase
MVDACADAGVLLQEAFMYRHHPSWVKAIRLVRSGAIGNVQTVSAAFSYYNDDSSNIRNRLENGGGAVMDIGCYPINVARLVFESEPDEVASVVRRDPQMGIDVVTSAVLGFPGGGQASFTCSTRAEDYQRVHILGTDGRIEIEIPFNIPPHRETRILVTSGGEPPIDPDTETIVFPPNDQYTVQAELFAAAVLSGGPVPVPPMDAVANMKVIEAVLAS